MIFLAACTHTGKGPLVSKTTWLSRCGGYYYDCEDQGKEDGSLLPVLSVKFPCAKF